MKLLSLLFGLSLLLLASSCHKCYNCEQYCVYCEKTATLRFKMCATKDLTKYQADSIIGVFRGNGYTCSKLTDERDVCDGSNKLNDAVNYYTKQDYYCNPKD
ncbi:MAG TPA: hypothetical protein VK174_11315 [Chitinophagales bacterium]|nr:hypothetical protein [Chitinophagales bacterium]HLP50879.1 hypothetical protein [Chitinophagales bacterium]